jgi:hypothetical protein
MRIFLSSLFILNGALAIAQQPGFQNQQRSTGVAGITPGQTARLNVLYPTAPAPLLQLSCSVTLNIADDQGKVLKTSTVAQILAGKSVSLDLNADVDLPGIPRTEIHAFSITTVGCNFVATLELIDNATQKTLAVVATELTFPFLQTAPVFAPLEPPAVRP